MKLTHEIKELLGEPDHVRGQIFKTEKGWTVKIGTRSVTLAPNGTTDDDEIRPFLLKYLHPTHNGLDYAEDGERYLFKKEIYKELENEES